MKKSAGFAFLEFSSHEMSKQFIENLNENPEQLMNHPFVVEFAIQDSRKLAKLSKKSRKIKNKWYFVWINKLSLWSLQFWMLFECTKVQPLHHNDQYENREDRTK